MIEIQKKNNFFSPIITCDICKKRIDDVFLAATITECDKTTGNTKVIHVHKGDCLESKIKKDPLTEFVELSRYLSFLLLSVKFTPAKFTDLVETDKEFGIIK